MTYIILEKNIFQFTVKELENFNNDNGYSVEYPTHKELIKELAEFKEPVRIIDWDWYEEVSNLIIELKVNESNGDENFRIQKHEEILAKLLVEYKLTLKEISFLKGVI